MASSDGPAKKQRGRPFAPGKSGNPSGRRTGGGRFDGWYSALTGLGTVAKDKRESTGFGARIVSVIEARELWRGSDIAARVIETIPREMFRQGFDVQIDDDKELGEEFGGVLEELSASDALRRAKEFERAYGGAAIFPVINDGTADLSLPLNEDRISSVGHLQVLEPRELTPQTYYTDPMNPKFGRPEMFLLTPLSGYVGSATVLIHETRLIVFPGIRVSRDMTIGTMAGWGDSVLSRLVEVLRDFETAYSSSAVLIADFAQAVWKMKDLAEIFAFDRDEKFFKRMQAMELSRSVTRAVIIDSEEEFKRESTSLTGLPDLLDRLQNRLAVAADMPQTKLFGRSPQGMSATGEGEARDWYDQVKSKQDETKPQVDRLVYLTMRAKDGPTGGAEPEGWCVEFRPLWQPSELDQANVRKVMADTDAVYIANAVLSPEEVAMARFGGGRYSIETQVDFAARERLEPAAAPPAKTEQQLEDEKRAADAAAAIAAGPAPGEDPELEPDEPPPGDDEPVE